jgi:hypothetical protein
VRSLEVDYCKVKSRFDDPKNSPVRMNSGAKCVLSMNYVAAELRGVRKIAVASLRTEVAAETAARIRQIRLRSKLRGIYILRRINCALFINSISTLPNFALNATYTIPLTKKLIKKGRRLAAARTLESLSFGDTFVESRVRCVSLLYHFYLSAAAMIFRRAGIRSMAVRRHRLMSTVLPLALPSSLFVQKAN